MGVPTALLKAGGVGGGGVGVVGAAGGSIAAAALGKEEKERGWIVPDGSAAVPRFFGMVKRDRWGRAKTVGPGRHWRYLLTHSLKHISTQDRFTDLPTQPIDCPSSGKTVSRNVNAKLTWRVSGEEDHPYRALYVPKGGEEELEQLVIGIGGPSVKAVMSSMDIDVVKAVGVKYFEEAWQGGEPVPDEVKDRYAEEWYHWELQRRVGERSQAQLLKYGVVMVGLSLMSDAISPQQKQSDATLEAAHTIAGAIGAATEALAKNRPVT